MKAYVISLKNPEATPLRDLAKAIRAAGLEPVIVPGVRGRDLPASVYYDMVVPRLSEGGSLLLPSEVGCAMSHHEVYRRLLASSEPQAVVLEDDVLAEPEEWARVAALARMPLEGRAFLHLGGMEPSKRWRRKVRSKAAGEGIWEIHPKDVVYFFRAVGYILPRATAEALLDAFGRGVSLADEFGLFQRRGAIDRFLLSEVVHHPIDLSGSAIEPERQAAGGWRPQPSGLGVALRREAANLRLLFGSGEYRRGFKR